MTERRYDLVIRGGTVYDGGGGPDVRADVGGGRDDRVTAVGPIADRGGAELDAAGLAVSPGFIDVHSHDDLSVLLDPRMDSCVREGVLDLPPAIYRMTGRPAAKFGLADRGAIRPRALADLVVFDPARIRDTATYDDPRRYPDGIRAVYVSGRAVARDGAHTGARPGRALRGR